MKEKKLIGVYGSLRQGMYNHRILAPKIETGDVTYIKTNTYKLPYKMVAYSSYPALIPEKDGLVNNIDMEIYAVDDDTYRRIEILEGYPSFYNKATLTDSFLEQPIEFYYIPDENRDVYERHKNMPHIKDWTRFYKLVF